MRFLILVLCSLLAVSSVAPSSALAVLGGQDIRVEQFEDDSANIAHTHDLVIASDGTCFHVVVHELSGNPTLIRVNRSTDGGSTWTLWGEISDPDPEVQFLYLHAVIAAGANERLLMAYNRRGPLGGPDRGTLQITAARVTDATPNWLTFDIDGPSSDSFRDLSLDAFPVAGGDTRLHLGYLRLESVTGWTRIFTRSLDGGATWSPEVSLGEVGQVSYYQQDIVSDEAGVVHWVWTDRELGETETTLRVRTAVGDGTLLGDWDTPTIVETTSSDPYVPVAAADPSGDGLVIAIEEAEEEQVRVLASLTKGATWLSLPMVWESTLKPSVAWGAAGPAVAVRFNESVVGSGPYGFGLIKPLDVDGLATWILQAMLWQGEFFFGRSAIAADPARGGQFAVIGGVQFQDETTESTWFDAEWRADPGYGVPEAVLPFDLSGSNYEHTSVAGDIDGDGDLEIVFAHNDGPQRGMWRYDLETDLAMLLTDEIDGDDYREAILVDIDGDGAREVFFSGSDSVHGYRGDGSTLPGFPIRSELSLVDYGLSGGQVTGFAHGEIIVPHENKVYVLGGDGQVQPGFPYRAAPEAGMVAGRVALGDVDADGSMELVAPYEGGLAIISNQGVGENFIPITAGTPHDPSLADLDGDGDLEIAVPLSTGSIYVLHHNGDSFGPNWPYASSEFGAIDAIALADLTGDSRRDLIFKSPLGNLVVLDTDGNPVATNPLPTGGAMTVASPIIAALGPDGAGIAYGDGAGFLHIVRGAQEQEGWPRDFGAPIFAALLASDLDNDGSVELVVESEDALWVLDMGVPAGPLSRGWRMHGARPERSNCADCPGYTASPVAEPVLPPVQTLLHANHPNPFNPSTTIRFEVPDQAGAVRLRVFDTAGRLVHTLVDEVCEAGAHSAIWNGRDEAGRTVASGVYLVRLDVDSTSQMRSMVLTK